MPDDYFNMLQGIGQQIEYLKQCAQGSLNNPTNFPPANSAPAPFNNAPISAPSTPDNNYPSYSQAAGQVTGQETYGGGLDGIINFLQTLTGGGRNGFIPNANPNTPPPMNGPIPNQNPNEQPEVQFASHPGDFVKKWDSLRRTLLSSPMKNTSEPMFGQLGPAPNNPDYTYPENANFTQNGLVNPATIMETSINNRNPNQKYFPVNDYTWDTLLKRIQNRRA